MLDKLIIKNFKCFDESVISMGKINLFCGINSSGKSTAIQALLLLAHNANEQVSSPLNGQWLSLGSFNETRNFIKNAKEFEISVENNKEKFGVLFIQPYDEAIDVETKKINSSPTLEKTLNFQNKHIFYLPATRLGPADYYQRNFDRVNTMGNNGEYIMDYFLKNQKKTVIKELIKDMSSNTLGGQVNYWLKKLLNVHLKVEEMGTTNTLSVLYSYASNKDVRPYHIGTGVSFMVGVIISCLAAEQNDIVIIENPEIHLHPKAQAELTEFLCFIANAGIQVVIETHSDHIFNGIRKAIAKKIIQNNYVAIHFFELNEKFLSINTKIDIAENGRVIQPRKGLFDQFDDDLDQILGLS
ncbi:MAG: hypothetical protein ACD_79C00270G0005 [uncultured bacterium]|nr:MAG: hypothetical protein ACD_79C00270G0005 [uncultured bacterium]